MRDLLAALLLGAVAACLPAGPVAAAEAPLAIGILDAAAADSSADVVASGVLDSDFEPFDDAELRHGTGAYWLKLQSADGFMPAGTATLNIRKSRHLQVDLFASGGGESSVLQAAVQLPGFAGMHEAVFILPNGLRPGEALYARVAASGGGAAQLRFSTSTLHETLARAAEHARMIAVAFGALMAMALAALLIWSVLSDKLLLLYATLFALQALYVAYLSGQGFEWPLLSLAVPVMSYTWNVCAALSGAAASLFVREIAELRRFSPRVYKVFGWFAAAFVVLAFANLAQHIGLGGLVAAIGNIVFVASAITTLIVAFLAWRRDNRAAGWFLIAWGLLEAFTIATALRLLLSDGENSTGLLYYGLPLSMVAAAVLIALGVADRLRDQRLALSDAERRAQTDALTGVLNRRSLIDRLDTACLRARARGLPIALLFIDLDHFKQINDTCGHPAGDACLKAIIGPIQAELRQSDVIGRYGGEEFVVILSSADVTAAQPIAERIRNRVADVRVEGFGAPINLTCSIGIATSDTLGVWGEHLIARADEAVYVAKRSGRNRVQIAANAPA